MIKNPLKMEIIKNSFVFTHIILFLSALYNYYWKFSVDWLYHIYGQMKRKQIAWIMLPSGQYCYQPIAFNKTLICIHRILYSIAIQFVLCSLKKKKRKKLLFFIWMRPEWKFTVVYGHWWFNFCDFKFSFNFYSFLMSLSLVGNKLYVRLPCKA